MSAEIDRLMDEARDMAQEADDNLRREGHMERTEVIAWLRGLAVPRSDIARMAADLLEADAREADQLMGDMAGVRKDERARVGEVLLERLTYANSMTRQIIAEVCGAPAPDAPDAPTKPDIVLDILSLVMEESELPKLEQIESWTPGQREEATDWAALEHLSAADNPVKRKPRPAFLPPVVALRAGRQG